MHKLWKRIHHHTTPSRQNAYRPHLLGKTWLIFFLAFSLTLEGFLVSSLVMRQSDGTFLTSTPQTQSLAAVSAAQEFQTLARQFFRVFGDPQLVNSMLGGVGGLVLLVVFIALFHHADVQSHEMPASGLVVAAVALLCMATNIHFLEPHTLSATGINFLDSPAAP